MSFKNTVFISNVNYGKYLQNDTCEKMLEENCIRVQFNCYKDNKESLRLPGSFLPFPFGSSSKASALHTSM